MEAIGLLPPFPPSLEIRSGFPHSRRFHDGFVFSERAWKQLSQLRAHTFSKSWYECGEELASVVSGLAAKDAVNTMEQLPHHRHKSLELGFMSALKSFIEGFHVRISLHCYQCRHVKGTAQVAIAGTADPRGPVYRSARGLMCRIETTMRDPFSDRHLWRQGGELTQDVNCTDLCDARDAENKIESLLCVVILSDQHSSLTTKARQAPLE